MKFAEKLAMKIYFEIKIYLRIMVRRFRTASLSAREGLGVAPQNSV